MEKSNVKNITLFAHDRVGEYVVEHLLTNCYGDIKNIVLMPSEMNNGNIYLLLEKYKFPKTSIFFYGDSFLEKVSNNPSFFSSTYFFLLWWPKIISSQIIDIPTNGVINLHPSYLPFCKGKDSNFWSIVEDTDFGVSIHLVTPRIDDGPIVFQRKIDKSWLDNGQTLYEKSKKEIVELFIESYSSIKDGKYSLIPQNKDRGSFHLRKELEPKSKIDLEKKYKAKDLLNLLRARTFDGHPACWFESDNEQYEVRISISKK